ncbi:cell division protein SepF [Cerasibacillus terrae]|uniref:Cell division protein SepF n=1 Tax=Cerasibacillus terrae TaxID=2498845 RepID=A0A5C8P2E4_9BACI|nr:cell division protein SepF [Cerasibacillus terrae]TXL67608.1 cell division protein SepF [Cerasibacillus terrae]
MSLKDKFKSLFETGEYEEMEVSNPSAQPPEEQSNVVNLTRLQEASSKMILCEPRTYNEVQEIADHLVNRRSVVFNLKRLDHEQAMRIVDFMSGTVYAVNGTIQKLGIGTFLCAPDNVNVSGAISDELNEESEINRGW